ncbi:OprD family porin [Metapseudomonas lalkuanensis]|uniref:OprD family porin n=1 Tax=Metapseudomonas lalkuanensis TaxID=2604832 RepID=A0A5J6QMR1_9GAMM|nr:OprD family porin [Pseudomonas lalkuanensis]QEY63065.1 OprD family porin [Pseudomonas lalkuanensis]
MSKLKFALHVLVPALGSVVVVNAKADFVGDSKLNLGLRNFYFNGDYREGANAPSKTEEWAQGFKLDYQSGFTEGTLGFGVDALGMLGVKLDTGKGRHPGSTMIPDDGDSAADEWSRFGLTAKLRLSKTEARIGTLLPNTPVLFYNDARLLPQTFQGGMITSKEIDNLTLTAGQLEQVTGRGSTDRTGFAVRGGREESNKFYFAGADYKIGSNLLVQYYQASMEDYYRQHFVGAVHTLDLGDQQSLKTDLRYFRTDSQGANASGEPGFQVSGFTSDGDGEIDNNTWSATFTYSVQGHSFLLGYQKVSDGSAFVQPNQGSLNGGVGGGGVNVYLYTNRLISNFTNAGETTRYAQYSYDFAAMGVPGLTASLMYLHGKDIKTFSGEEQREWERDFNLSYVFQSGPLKGLSATWWNASARGDVVRPEDQNRLIFNYTLPIF